MTGKGYSIGVETQFCIRNQRNCGFCRTPLDWEARDEHGPKVATVAFATFDETGNPVLSRPERPIQLSENRLFHANNGRVPMRIKGKAASLFAHETSTSQYCYDCDRSDKMTPGTWLHPACADLSTCFNSTFLQATTPRSTPCEADSRDRMRFIQNFLADCIQRLDWPQGLPHLPLEIWLKITQHILDSADARATFLRPALGWVASQQVADFAFQPQYSQVSLAKPIYASYVRFEGRCYIQGLYNSNPEGDIEDSLITGSSTCAPLHNDKVAKGGRVFIADDYLGIRGVFFVPSSRLDEWSRDWPRLPGVWWRSFNIVNDLGNPHLIMETDVRLRTFELSRAATNTSPIH